MLDRRTDDYAALKVQKSAENYTEAAYDEIELLSQLASGDPNNEKGIVRLLDHFHHVGPHGRRCVDEWCSLFYFFLFRT